MAPAATASHPIVRRATPEDAPSLARLRYEFRAAVSPPEETEDSFVPRCEAWMAARLAPASSSWCVWVADAGEDLVGTVWLQLLEKIPNPVAEPERHGYVSNLFVQPSHRGYGLGAALMEAALRECDDSQVDAVVLWPTPRSRSLYQRFGFEVRDDLMERRGGRP